MSFVSWSRQQGLMMLMGLLYVLILQSSSQAQEYAKHEVPLEIPKPDIEAELKAFKLAEGFQIAPFAINPKVANPVSITWDERGRMWVGGSMSYPHLRPGQVPNDRIVILEDTDGDFKADKSTIFAEGLLVPHAVYPTDKGVYVCASTEFLLLKDTDGDDRADAEEVIFSGFGNEDVHHVIHTLTRGPDGSFYFNQSININSLIETPFGRRRMDGSGIWKYDPYSGRLDSHITGIVNPWGHVFDRWGQEFATDGAGAQGIHYIFPGASLLTAVGAKDILKGLGNRHPKYCGLAILDSSHLPEKWQGRFVTNDFRANRIVSFEVTEDGSGYRESQKEDLLRSSHVSFRPVEIKVGPDGAIYVVDWYNPIIDHGEVDFHHPARDKSHGRIWRISAIDREPVQLLPLLKLPHEKLYGLLGSPDAWTRQTVRRLLQEAGRREAQEKRLVKRENTVKESDLLKNLILRSHGEPHFQLELLWVAQGRNESNLTESVNHLIKSEDHRVRSAVVRVIHEDHSRIDNAIDLLRETIEDSHPRVRLESLRALAAIGTLDASSIVIAAPELGDRFIRHAHQHSVRELSPIWIPANSHGKWIHQAKELVLSLLFLTDSELAAAEVLRQLREDFIQGEDRLKALSFVARRGNSEGAQYVFNQLGESKIENREKANLLKILIDSTFARGVAPETHLDRLKPWLTSSDSALQEQAIRACGSWEVIAFKEDILGLVKQQSEANSVLVAGLSSLASLGESSFLSKLSRGGAPLPLRFEATLALTRLDIERAAIAAATLLTQNLPKNDLSRLLNAFLYSPGGSVTLAEKLTNVPLEEDTAKLGFETTRLAPDPNPELLAIFRGQGGAPKDFENLSPERMRTLVDRVARLGVASKGEKIYRREKLACFTCHAIGGAGGSVGPDLSSIGTTSPTDYLIESLLEPEKKVKEYYRSKSYILSDGRLLTGIPKSSNQDETKVMLEDGKVVTLTAGMILQVNDAPSLMPNGLVDPLGEDEFLHLVRFLSELGKVGTYSLPSQSYVRKWKVENPNPNSISKNEVSIYATVSGYLPLNELKKYSNNEGEVHLYFEVDAENKGTIQVAVNSPEGILRLVNSGGQKLDRISSIQVSAGRQKVSFKLSLGERTKDLRLELLSQTPNSVRAQLVSGI